MADVTVNGFAYKTGKMNAIKQFHVARRLLPIIAKLVELKDLSSLQVQGQEEGAMGSILAAIASSLTSLSDADCDFILAACLSVCQRQQPGGGWATVWNTAAGQPQFADLDLPTMMQLVMATLQENMASFMPAPPQP